MSTIWCILECIDCSRICVQTLFEYCVHVHAHGSLVEPGLYDFHLGLEHFDLSYLPGHAVYKQGCQRCARSLMCVCAVRDNSTV
jgi:hypothetical protein